uniref:Uncharacterized protein n=1 Tax=Arundo donax TaxID=35708 RepID=A0A0A8ZW44_ARUDO
MYTCGLPCDEDIEARLPLA